MLPDLTPTDIDYRALALWAIGEDTTPNSRLIAHVTLGLPLSKQHARQHARVHPNDMWDMRCCLHLVRSVPGVRERLDALRFLSPVWNALVDNWPDLEADYDSDTTIQKEDKRRRDRLFQESDQSDDAFFAIYEELPEPKSKLHRALLVILETYGGPDYARRVAIYDAPSEPIEFDDVDPAYLDDPDEDEEEETDD
jgi:hypothetical protein